MAVGYISKPGVEYGPCKKACKHKDCAASRASAACVCRICEKPIGYETGCLDEWYDAPKNEMGVAAKGRYGYFVHAVCLMNEVDARRKMMAGEAFDLPDHVGESALAAARERLKSAK